MMGSSVVNANFGNSAPRLHSEQHILTYRTPYIPTNSAYMLTYCIYTCILHYVYTGIILGLNRT